VRGLFLNVWPQRSRKIQSVDRAAYTSRSAASLSTISLMVMSRRGLDEPENVITVRIELRAARLSLTASCSIAGLAHPVNPADRRRQPDPKLCRRPTRRQPTERSINHAVTQILAVSSCHGPPPI
jgi:hypothetical protein